MFISAVILSFNSKKHLNKCLDSLIPALQTLEKPSEIFVVDNGSTDGSVEILKQYQQQYSDILKPIFFKENTGTTFSRNSALRQATGDYILVCDSDAYVTSSALQQLTQYLAEHPETGMAVPRLFYASGNFQLSCDQFPTLWHKLKRFLLLKKIEMKQHPLAIAKQPIDVDYAISACWVISRAAFEKTGLLDENIFYSPEDVDYCIRIWQSGYKITYIPSAHVVHDAQELSRGFKLSVFHFSHLKGLFYLFNKFHYFWGLKGLYKRINRHRAS
jgi:GT2 family glycosyltransferase